MLQILGSIVVLGCVFGGFVLEGGNILSLWHPTEILIIVGAALGAFMTSNPPKVSKAAFIQALTLPKGARYKRDDYVTLLKLVYDILMKIRKDGLLAIEGDIEAPEKSPLFQKYPVILADHHMVVFITDCLRLIIGGYTRSARAREPARIRARDASQGSARARACRAEGGRRAARLRHRGGGARHREHHERASKARTRRPSATRSARRWSARSSAFWSPTASSGRSPPRWSIVRNEEGKAFEVVKMALVASVRGYAPHGRRRVRAQAAVQRSASDVRRPRSAPQEQAAAG